MTLDRQRDMLGLLPVNLHHAAIQVNLSSIIEPPWDHISTVILDGKRREHFPDLIQPNEIADGANPVRNTDQAWRTKKGPSVGSGLCSLDR